MSDLLTPDELEAIRKANSFVMALCDPEDRDKDIAALLAHLAAQDAEIAELQDTLKELGVRLVE